MRSGRDDGVHADGSLGGPFERRRIERAADAGLPPGDPAVHRSGAAAAERAALARDRRTADHEDPAAADGDARDAPARHGVSDGLHQELAVVRRSRRQGQLPAGRRIRLRRGRAHR